MKKLLLLLSFTFIPILNAQTYYDYEKVEVEQLPTASADTTDKVYIFGKSYYVTESKYISGTQRPIQLNDNLVKGKIYFKGITKEEFDSLPKFSLASPLKYSPSDNRDLITLYNNGGKAQIRINKKQLFLDYRSIYFPYDGFYIDISDDLYFNSSSGENVITFIDEDYRGFLDKFFVYEFDSYTVYSWKEVSKSDVYDIIVKDDDFYFFFSYNDISNFNILSSYDFSNFTDFEKIVVVLGFNIFFLMFLGFIVYIFIKFINKGITLLFR